MKQLVLSCFIAQTNCLNSYGKPRRMLAKFALPSPNSKRRRRIPTSEFVKFRFIVLLSLALCFLGLSIPLPAEAVEFHGQPRPWTSVINTSTGPVRGEVLTTVVKNLKYSSFRSIRYAEPTTGDQRFKPPIPAKPWKEILNATVEPGGCAQINFITHNYAGSEDCLFLNIFTPVTEFGKEDKKAVMVWIYGGSFVTGNAKTILYGPDFLLEDDVILVTLDYRVGPLGFLSLDHQNATGNAGLKDQLLALQWVKENIGKFGGNDEKITIFGDSAGAVCVDLHTLSERSRGLFHRVISISGSALNPWAFHTPREAVSQGFKLGSLLGTITEDKEVLLRSLYEATALDIVARAAEITGEVTAFRPTVEDPSLAGDNAFLTETPLSKYKSGNFTKVPYVTGFTAQETAYIVTNNKIQSITDLVASALSIIEQIDRCMPAPTALVDNLLTDAANSLNKIAIFTREELVQHTTFKYMTAGIDVKQRFLNDKSSEPVYYYRVSFDPPKSFGELLYHTDFNGTAHMDDLAYIFYMPIVDLPLDERDPISITRRRVVRMWTNFAKYGNPTPDGEADPLLNITWPASGSSGRHLEIGEELSVGERPVDARENYIKMLED